MLLLTWFLCVFLFSFGRKRFGSQDLAEKVLDRERKTCTVTSPTANTFGWV